ncbi:unannotated protein [freshwater metagenome]|uniref:Unannotated protein n=1 Tax=freshwater metagenome TaxID=449393 RepID=A0A6J6ZF82_9ZZZZ
MRKSLSAPVSACMTWSMYNFCHPRSGEANACVVAAFGVRFASSSSEISILSVRAATSRTIMSPVCTTASGPPAAASGATWRTTVPYAVPLIRPSQIRTISRTPFSNNFFGSGMFATSGIPG